MISRTCSYFRRGRSSPSGVKDSKRRECWGANRFDIIVDAELRTSWDVVVGVTGKHITESLCLTTRLRSPAFTADRGISKLTGPASVRSSVDASETDCCGSTGGLRGWCSLMGPVL